MITIALIFILSILTLEILHHYKHRDKYIVESNFSKSGSISLLITIVAILISTGASKVYYTSSTNIIKLHNLSIKDDTIKYDEYIGDRVIRQSKSLMGLTMKYNISYRDGDAEVIHTEYKLTKKYLLWNPSSIFGIFMKKHEFKVYLPLEYNK